MSAGTVAALVEGARRAALEASVMEPAWLRPYDADRYQIVTMCGTFIDESRTVPPVDGLQILGAEAALVAQGWRFLALPTFRRLARRKLSRALEWDVRTWLAVPPDSADMPARRFTKKADAFAWAAGVTTG